MPNLSFEMRRMKKRIEEEAAAVTKEMEEKKMELQQLNKEMEELEQTISEQEAVIRSLSSAEPDKSEITHLEDWVKTTFDRVTAGPHQERFSQFKDPFQQLEVIRDLLRLARANKTGKA